MRKLFIFFLELFWFSFLVLVLFYRFALIIGKFHFLQRYIFLLNSISYLDLVYIKIIFCVISETF